MWRPSTVEDIQAWTRGEYRLNPTGEQALRMMINRLRDSRLNPDERRARNEALRALFK